MVAKKETVTSLKREVAELNKQAADLASKLKHSESMKDMYQRSSSEHQEEINAVHDLLDVLPGAIERKQKDGYSEHKLMTRLASFLVHRPCTQSF